MFNVEELNKKVKDYKVKSNLMRKDLINFFSSLELKFNDGSKDKFSGEDGLCYELSYFTDSCNIEDVLIKRIDFEGIHIDDGYEGEDEIEYDRISLEDLIDLVDPVIESPEFKKKYLKRV